MRRNDDIGIHERGNRMKLKKHEIIYYYVKIHNEIKRKSKKSDEMHK